MTKLIYPNIKTAESYVDKIGCQQILPHWIRSVSEIPSLSVSLSQFGKNASDISHLITRRTTIFGAGPEYLHVPTYMYMINILWRSRCLSRGIQALMKLLTNFILNTFT